MLENVVRKVICIILYNYGNSSKPFYQETETSIIPRSTPIYTGENLLAVFNSVIPETFIILHTKY